MTAVPPEDIALEVLEDGPVESEEFADSKSVDVIVTTVTSTLSPESPDVIEVPEYPPLGGGYYHAEVLPFTAQGNLSITTEPSQFPIAQGTYRLRSITGRVVTAPTGSPVVVDIRKNGVSIFGTPGDRPTFASGQNSAVVGDFGTVMLAGGDYLEAMITAVGVTTPGKNLVMSLRLERVGN